MTLAELFKDLTEDKHCTGHLAVDENGEDCHEFTPDAKKWCAIGWVLRAFPMHAECELNKLEAHANSLGYDTAGTANDEMGYAFIKSIQENCK